jgi:hypothetical protein
VSKTKTKISAGFSINGSEVIMANLKKMALPGFGWIIPLFRVSGKGSNRRSEKV